MTRRQKIGKEGEDEAVEYLKNKRYRIIERNYWKPWGELDVIARAPDTTLVFIEVKTIYTNLTSKSNQFTPTPSQIPHNPDIRASYEKVWGFINPEDNMTRAKIIKTKRAAELYANNNRHLVTQKGWRIDLVAVAFGPYGPLDIKHYENI